jgi:uncharacterized membrane protein
MTYWPLASIALVALGFVLRWNAAVVVVSAGLLSGVLSGRSLDEVLALLGESFAGNRSLLLFIATLPAIGVLERAGLREHAQGFVTRLRGLTLARLLIVYLALRQLSSMVGLTHVAGHAQTVRPLLAPMSEAAAKTSLGELTEKEREAVRALAAATDNVGLFFGEDVFVAIGAVLLIQSFYAQNDIALEPLEIARWAAPTAAVAFVVHALRIALFEKRLRDTRARRTPDAPP